MSETPFEHPDDQKPVSEDAMRERKRAIREGRLQAPPRDEMPRPSDDPPVEMDEKPPAEPVDAVEGSDDPQE